MRTTREDGFEIDTDPGRADVARVHAWLSNDAYWARGRTRAAVERSLANSTCFGLYNPAGEQVGLARVVTDGATFAWLCDVYLAPPVRGQGLGSWLVDTARRWVLDAGVPRIVLATADAHAVYARLGFVPLPYPDRYMAIDTRDLSGFPDQRDVAHT
jgi:GNAT superfamily N-acetyltransferase